MPNIEVKIKKNGKIETDYHGFPNSSCDQAENELIARLRDLKMKRLNEDRKDDELLQEEMQTE